MLIIDKGKVHPKVLIEYLDERLDNKEKYESYDYLYQMPHNLFYIHNIDNAWSVSFRGIPEMRVLLNLFCFFSEKVRGNTGHPIDHITINYYGPNPKKFEFSKIIHYYDYDAMVAEVIKYVAEENRNSILIEQWSRMEDEREYS